MSGMYGEEGTVRHEQYCMSSEQKENVDEMNKLSGYHNMADKANTEKYPTKMGGERRNTQLMNGVPGKYDHPK